MDLKIDTMNINEYKLYNDLEWSHWWFRSRREALTFFLSKIDKKDEKTLLDVGCGAGWNMKILYNSFKNVEGIDYNPSAVFYSKKNFGGKVELKDANDLSKIENSYDVISFLDVLYHKDISDHREVLKACWNILNKDGYVLISDGAFEILSGHHSKNVNGSKRFTKTQLIEELKCIGYEVVIAKYWGFFLFFGIFFKRRVIEKLLFFIPRGSDIKKLPNFINFFGYLMVSWERKLFKYLNLPLGSSIIILAKKNQRKNK